MTGSFTTMVPPVERLFVLWLPTCQTLAAEGLQKDPILWEVRTKKWPKWAHFLYLAYIQSKGKTWNQGWIFITSQRQALMTSQVWGRQDLKEGLHKKAAHELQCWWANHCLNAGGIVCSALAQGDSVGACIWAHCAIWGRTHTNTFMVIQWALAPAGNRQKGSQTLSSRHT